MSNVTSNRLPVVSVLVVDDEPVVLESVENILLRIGYHVCGARSVEQALESVNNISIHMVLCDISMPQTDGWKLLDTIKREHDNIAVIMMTDCDDSNSAQKALERGADEYIGKPIHFDELSSVLEKISWKYMPAWYCTPVSSSDRSVPAGS